MKKKILNNLLFAVIISAISFLFTILAYSKIPEQIIFLSPEPVSKEVVVYILPIITIAVGLTISFFPLFYRLLSKDTELIAPKSYRNITVIITGALLFMQIIALCNWLEYTISLSNIAIAAFGFICALIGNFMPRFKKGSLIAIYNPWTERNDKTWLKTHRVGGYIWLFGGIGIIFMILVPQNYNLWLVIAIFVICLLSPHIYSYFYNLRLNKKAGKND